MKPTEIDVAYLEMKDLIKQGEEIAQAVEHYFQYSPFKYISGKIKSEVRELRAELIKHFINKYNTEYTPNYKPSVNFTEMMDKAEGQEGFNSLVIKKWFERQAADKNGLKALSLQQMIDKARNFLPGGHWNPPKVKDIIQGNILELRAYTWRSGDRWSKGSLSYGINQRGEYEALDRLIDVATRRADPSITGRSSFLTDHLLNARTPEQFYGKHEVKHKTVEAFQFFKNDKFKIWFKQPRHARAVARRLVNKSGV